MKKWFTGRIVEDDGVNWGGVVFLICFVSFLVGSFPHARKMIHGKDGVEVKEENGVVCAKPRHSSERAWTCWEKSE